MAELWLIAEIALGVFVGQLAHSFLIASLVGSGT